MKILDIPQSGKAGLFVSYKGRNGQVRRGYIVPTNPNTAYQQSVRSTLSSVSQRFRSLTKSQIDAWDTAAAKYQTRSRLGQSGPMTGFQLFSKLNATLLQFGADQIDTPPGRPNLPACAVQGLVITNSSGTISVKLTCPTNPGSSTSIRAAGGVSPAVRATPSMRIIGMCPVPTAGAADITSLYTARFGAPVAGDQIFVDASVIDTTNGWQGPRFVYSAVVPTSS